MGRAIATTIKGSLLLKTKGFARSSGDLLARPWVCTIGDRRGLARVAKGVREGLFMRKAPDKDPLELPNANSPTPFGIKAQSPITFRLKAQKSKPFAALLTRSPL